MYLASLATQGFRNLKDARVALAPGLNLIVGRNGQGKTNLLEAAYVLSTTRSFRTSRMSSLPAIGTASYHVSGERIDDQGLTTTMGVGVDRGRGRREARINGEPVPIRRYVQALPAIAYSQARLDIVRGGPEERRRLLDRGIAHLEPLYLDELTRFQQTLRQRNSLLTAIRERRASRSSIEPWDQQYLDASAAVRDARAKFVRSLVARFFEIVSRHTYPLDALSVDYAPSLYGDEGDVPEEDAIELYRDREIAAGHSVRGPHRDDLLFRTEDLPASEILSSGRIKMLVLFLKLARIELFRERWGRSPLFLLDDVDAELDLDVIATLLEGTAEMQVLATSAKGSIFEQMNLPEHRLLRVSDGAFE